MTIIAWILALVAGCLDGQYRIIFKRSGLGLWAFIFATEMLVVFILAIVLLANGLPTLTGHFWLAALLIGPILTAAFGLTGAASRASHLSVVGVYTCLTPTFMLAVSPLFGLPGPTRLGVLGIFISTVGIYVLNMESARESLWVPIVRAWSDRGGRMMIGVAAIFAFTANVFAVGVDSSSGPAFALTAHVGVLACVTVIISRWRQKGLRLSIWAHRRDVLKAVVCMAGSDIVFPIAYTLMPVMALVIIGKRTGQTLWGSLRSMQKAKEVGDAHAGEAHAAGYRLVGATLCLIGMAIVILWGRHK